MGVADGIGVRALRAVDEVQPETCFSWHEVNAKAHDMVFTHHEIGPGWLIAGHAKRPSDHLKGLLILRGRSNRLGPRSGELSFA